MRHDRRSVRLPGHDYRLAGAYVVTLCTAHRAPILARIHGCGTVEQSLFGRVVDETWEALPHHVNVRIDAFVVMPDHVHGVLWIENAKESTFEGRRAGHPPARSLHSAVGAFKSAVTRRARREGQWPFDAAFWQRGFYESVVRGPDHLERVRAYIARNPAQWAMARDRVTR